MRNVLKDCVLPGHFEVVLSVGVHDLNQSPAGHNTQVLL